MRLSGRVGYRSASFTHVVSVTGLTGFTRLGVLFHTLKLYILFHSIFIPVRLVRLVSSIGKSMGLGTD